MRQVVDLDRWPLGALDGPVGQSLVSRCREDLHDAGMFSLPGLIRPEALRTCVAEVADLFESASFTHARDHNIYFDDEIESLDAGHPALRRFTTVNRTICGDQIPASTIEWVYEWQPLIDFLAAAMDKPRLYPMADPLGRLNVMSYREGERLNWHFDRAEFTITVLLQAPRGGGDFQYRSGLRSDIDPNYEGVARLLAGDDTRVRTLPLAPGTLNVFKGKNTAHRVTPVEGDHARIIAVFSYYETPDVTFSDTERLGLLRPDGPRGRRGIEARDDCRSLLQSALPRLRATGGAHGAHGLAGPGRTQDGRFPAGRSSRGRDRRRGQATQPGLYGRLRHAPGVPAGSLAIPLWARALLAAASSPIRARESRAATATPARLVDNAGAHPAPLAFAASIIFRASQR